MMADRLRVLVGLGVAAGGVAMLAGGCGSSSSSLNGTPTMSATPVPVLGSLTLKSFPSTVDGAAALQLCEGWAQLRGQYVSNVENDTAHQLGLFFSEPQWAIPFADEGKIEPDPAYEHLYIAFGQATVVGIASINNGRHLDAACSAS